MTNPTGGEWKTYASFIYSNEGNICTLSDPKASREIGYTPLDIGSDNWDEAIANGKLIVDAVKAYRKVIELFGLNWQDELAKLKDISEAM